jgi:hypothetical protein
MIRLGKAKQETIYMGKETVTTPGNKRRIQVRKARPDGFTEAKRQVFLDTLAMCCTVTAAAKAAGISTVTVNYHRRRDPVFAQQEAEALAAGYVYLEAASLARAARGGHYEPGEGAGDGAAGGTPGAEALDPEMALHLLQLRQKGLGRRTGDGGPAPKRVSLKELDESIRAKLEILNRRLTGGKALRQGSGQALKRHEVRKVKSPKEGKVALPRPAPGQASAQDERNKGEERGPRIR